MTYSRRVPMCLLPAAVLVLLTVEVQAQQVQPGDIHIGIGAGAIFTEPTKFSAVGNIAGLDAAASGKLGFDTGASVVGFADYGITRYLNALFQLGYVTEHIASFQGNLSLGNIGRMSGSVRTDGNIGSLAGLVNIVVVPFGGAGSVTPYFGGGIGFASSHVSLRSADVLGSTLPLDVSSSETDLAADLLVGVDYKVGTRGYIGLAYQFVRISASNLGSTGTLRAKTGAIESHFLGALFELRF